jgi:hypothetical protein
LDDLPAMIPYVTKMTLILFAKKQEAMPIVINELPNKMETLQLDRLIWVLQISSRIHNKKFTEYCLFKGVISKNLSDMNVIRKIEFPIIGCYLLK